MGKIMKESKFNDWEKGIFSVVGIVGGPPSTEITYTYRRDNLSFPHNGRYSDTDITYAWNKHGFRSEEFVDDGRDSILVIGCSSIVGIGAPLEHTIGYRLRDKRNPALKLYNLAMAPVSSEYISRALYKTIDELKPRAVFILWPHQTIREIAVRGRYVTYKAFSLATDNSKDFYKMFAPIEPTLLDWSYIKYQKRKDQIFCESLCAERGIPLMQQSEIPDEIFEHYFVNQNEVILEKVLNLDLSAEPFTLMKHFQFPFARDNCHFSYEWADYFSDLFLEEYKYKIQEK